MVIARTVMHKYMVGRDIYFIFNKSGVDPLFVVKKIYIYTIVERLTLYCISLG